MTSQPSSNNSPTSEQVEEMKRLIAEEHSAHTGSSVDYLRCVQCVIVVLNKLDEEAARETKNRLNKNRKKNEG